MASHLLVRWQSAATIADRRSAKPFTLIVGALHGFCMGSLQIALTLGGTLSGPIGVVDIPQSTLAARLAGHSDKVVRACWHPQNLWVVSGGTDRKVILWKP